MLQFYQCISASYATAVPKLYILYHLLNEHFKHAKIFLLTERHVLVNETDEANDDKFFSSALRIDVTPDLIGQSVINELIPLSMNSFRYPLVSTC